MNNPNQPSLFSSAGDTIKMASPPAAANGAQTFFQSSALNTLDFLPGGQMILLTGGRDLISLSHYLAAERLIGGESVVFVDGANSIDLPFILRLARFFRADPRSLLKRLHLSRAFTAHQLEAVITRDLAGAMRRFDSSLCIVSGLLDTPADDQVPLWEAETLVRNLTGRLQGLAARNGCMVVIAPDPPIPSEKTRKLLPIVREAADRTFQLSSRNGRIVLSEVKNKPRVPDSGRHPETAIR